MSPSENIMARARLEAARAFLDEVRKGNEQVDRALRFSGFGAIALTDGRS